MRLMRLTILLAATICCIADKDAVTAQADKQIAGQQTVDTTTAVPKITPSIAVANTTDATNKINGSIVSPPPSTKDTVNSTTTEAPSTISNVTTSHPTPSTTPLPTTKPNTTTTTTTTAPLTTKEPLPTVTSNPSTVAPPPATTAVPVSTKAAPPSPYKERHFDGLSFLGGIILATSLMAIGALSWKFYRTFNERNYRTL